MISNRVFRSLLVAVALPITALAQIASANAQPAPLRARIEAGIYHSVGLSNDGTVWTWGYNNYGQLGNGTTTNKSTPVKAGSLAGIAAVAAGGYHTLALKSDGTVWAWGYNTYGQLGNGTTTNKSAPVQVTGLSGIIAISAGYGHSLALKSDGTVWAWGRNEYGQLGDGTTTNKSTPFRVGAIAGVAAIAAGDCHTVVLKTDGTVWSWGSNYYGQVGVGTAGNKYGSPMPALGLTNVATISAGRDHTAAVKSDGTLWTWGGNSQGQLGNGTTTDVKVPVPVLTLAGVATVSAGDYHTVAMKTDGTVWAWGRNVEGELGNGTTTNTRIPLRVLLLTGAIAVTAGSDFSLAVKSDGSVWAWGGNCKGQLGIGSTTNSKLAVKVNGLTVEIDECATNNGGCSVNATCTHVPGKLGDAARICACKPGYAGDGVTCVADTFGVVALNNVGSIGILDSHTQSLASVNLTGELGTIGGGLFDVAITPDGKTTLVSNFGDAKVYFINTTNPATPSILGSVTTSYMNNETPPREVKVFAEDIAITPDGRYALVTDGGFSPSIFVLDIASRTIASRFDDTDSSAVPPIQHMHQAVAVAPDGKTVLTVDYFGRNVNVLTLSTDGHLTFVGVLDVSVPVWDPVAATNVKTFYPVNVEISPDGKTAIVAGTVVDWKDVGGTIPADLVFPVLKIASPGVVTLNQIATSVTPLKGAQSVVFNRAGTKAYVMCTQPLPSPMPTDPEYPGPNNVIKVLNVTGPGTASDANVSVEVNIYGRSQLFGVDTLAMDNAGRYLYVSNPTLSGAKNYIQIVDTTTNTMVKQITFADIDVPTEGLTTPHAAGISFWRL